MTALTDRDSLIIAAQSGNEVSLDRLLKECRADVRRYAERHCEMSEVDDAVQETLSRARSETVSVLDAPPLFRTARSQFIFVERAIPLPPIHIERIDGKLVDLATFRGKAILVNLWATWCPPCARELPLLERLHHIVRSEPLEIVAVSIDAPGPDAVKTFLKRRHVERLPIYLDPARRFAKNVDEEGTSPFILYGLPMSYVVDRYGRIAGYLIGEADWSSAEGLGLLRYYIKGLSLSVRLNYI